jgi:hypothetical protein
MPTLRAASTVVSPPRKPYVADASRLAFYRDLVEPFGSTVEENLLRSGAHVSHHDLIERLAQGPDIENSKPDLIILTHALPDIHPFSVAAPHLNLLLGGKAICMGISQQGLAAPFTALRVVAGYQQSGRCGEAVVAVLEQTTLPTRFPLVHDTPLVDSGVLLVLDQNSGPELGGVETVSTEASLTRRLAELADDVEGTLLVLGPWFKGNGLPGGLRIYRVNSGTYCTSVWLALARHWWEWQQEYATVILCDTDPQTGVSHLAVLRWPLPRWMP